MKNTNIFLIKEFVDNKISEQTEKVDTKELVKEFQKEIQQLDDEDFIEVMISCFIPDTYKNNGKKEKLYTKLAEVLVAEWWKRVGGQAIVQSKKSGIEDVELAFKAKSIVCDAKIFRLGRSQKAPNPKDFLKLTSVKKWMANLVERYNKNGNKQDAIGGMVTYSSLHEWGGESDVYLDCTEKLIPVVMLPYEKLNIESLIVKRKVFTLPNI